MQRTASPRNQTGPSKEESPRHPRVVAVLCGVCQRHSAKGTRGSHRQQAVLKNENIAIHSLLHRERKKGEFSVVYASVPTIRGKIAP